MAVRCTGTCSMILSRRLHKFKNITMIFYDYSIHSLFLANTALFLGVRILFVQRLPHIRNEPPPSNAVWISPFTAISTLRRLVVLRWGPHNSGNPSSPYDATCDKGITQQVRANAVHGGARWFAEQVMRRPKRSCSPNILRLKHTLPTKVQNNLIKNCYISR